MPALAIEVRGQPARNEIVFKSVTTIGDSLENDISIRGASLDPTHAHVVREDNGFSVIAMSRDMTVNQRREKKRKLANLDVIRIGDVVLTWYENEKNIAGTHEDRDPRARLGAVSREVLTAYEHIHAFSEQLLQNAATPKLVDTLLDAIIELTGADKGFLVLLNEQKLPTVRAARNVDRQTLEPSVESLSDSVLRRVFETQKPLVIADALSDEAFCASASIVSLRVVSVMCCPLVDRGNLIGALYVGNHRAARVFDAFSLQVLTVFAAQASLLLSQARRLEELEQAKTTLERELLARKLGGIVGACDSMKEIFRRVRKIATTDVAVLVTGETGTGKELIAREIHGLSRRASGPFLAVNCGAIPENLLESELFGYVRGAFTGAVQTKLGRFQAANGGTLFLDEIGDLPLALQVKLLRAIEEHTVTKVGDTRAERVDIRVLAATHRNLESDIKAGRFREDLYYRLNVVNIHLPPLRERADDIDLLAQYFLERARTEHPATAKGFSKSCLHAMRAYPWPGNIRQLENRIKKAMVFADHEQLEAADLDIHPEELRATMSLAEAREKFETRYIQEVLDRNAGNRTKAAKELGVDPRTIFRYLKKQGADGCDDAQEEASSMQSGDSEF